jgi:hypothetical protein
VQNDIRKNCFVLSRKNLKKITSVDYELTKSKKIFKYLSASMCTTLACRKSDQTTDCEQIPGIGAAEGTTCGSGKVEHNL